MKISIENYIKRIGAEYVTDLQELRASIIASDNSLNEFDVEDFRAQYKDISSAGSIDVSSLYDNVNEEITFMHVQVLRGDEDNYMVNDYVFSISQGGNSIGDFGMFSIANASNLSGDFTISWLDPATITDATIAILIGVKSTS